MSIQLNKFSSDGKAAGSLAVSDEVFGIEPNRHVLYLAVRRQLANARIGSANSKTRSEIRGGGKKPWRQKGTGRARAGSNRSPLWVGGGVIFGPKPRDFSFKLPKKVRALAIRSSLSSARDRIFVVENFSFIQEPKTKRVASFLKSLSLEGKKVLVLADYKADENQNLKLASRNIEGLKLSLPHNISVYDILHADAVIMTQAAAQEFDERYGANV